MRYTLALGLVAPFMVQPVLAQTDDVERREDTIIVSAPGPQRAAGELISHVTKVDRDEIVGDLANTLGDTLDRQPGVATTFFGAGASRPVLRGLGAERVLVLSNTLGAIDVSAASPDHQVSAEAIDAESIEILRGPAALAYGGQAIGGVVNVIDGLIASEQPEKVVSGDAFIAGHSVNDGVEAAGHAEFAAGPLVFNLSASTRDFEDYDVPGYVESAFQRAAEEEEHHDEDEDHDEDHDDDDHDEHEEEEEALDTVENSFLKTNTLAGGVSYVGEKGFLGVSVRHTTSEYGLPGHSHAHGHEEEEHHDEDEDHDEEDHDEEEHSEEENPFIDLEHTRVDVRGAYDLNGDIFTRVEGAFMFADYEHTEFEAPGEAGTVYTNEGYEGRVEIDHAFNGLLGSFGAQFVETEFSVVGEEAFVTPTDTQSFAAFLFETYELQSGTGFEGGLRLESVTHDNATLGKQDFDLVSGSVGVHRHLDNGIFLGGQVSYTQRAPTPSELFANGPHLATNQFEIGSTSIGTESAFSFEGTARFESGPLSIGANAFITNFDGFIYLTPGTAEDEDGDIVDELDELPVFLFAQENADFVGFEIYGDYAFESKLLGASWSVAGSVDYVDAELDSGGNAPYLPPLTFNGDLRADWDAFDVTLETTYAAEQDDPSEGVLPTESYTVFNLKAGVELGELFDAAKGVRAFVDVRNLSDEEVRYATSVVKDLAPAPGRNVRFGVKATF